MSSVALLSRWLARALSIGALLFVLLMALGELPTMHTFTGYELLYLVVFVAGLLANILAWRWEKGGAVLALLALAALIAIDRVNSGRFPGVWFFGLLGLPAFFFLLARTLGAMRSRPEDARI